MYGLYNLSSIIWEKKGKWSIFLKNVNFEVFYKKFLQKDIKTKIWQFWGFSKFCSKNGLSMGLYAKNDVFSMKIEHFGDKIGILVFFYENM